MRIGFQEKDFRNEDFRTRIFETRISGLKDLEDKFSKGLKAEGREKKNR